MRSGTDCQDAVQALPMARRFLEATGYVYTPKEGGWIKTITLVVRSANGGSLPYPSSHMPFQPTLFSSYV